MAMGLLYPAKTWIGQVASSPSSDHLKTTDLRQNVLSLCQLALAV